VTFGDKLIGAPDELCCRCVCRSKAIGPDSGGEYFAVHQHLDIEHSAELRALCPEGSQEAAAAVSEALWNLLTSVEAAPAPV
jgi:hypothetical protein